MNEGIICNHNKFVHPDDDVYILGDIAMKCSWQKAMYFVSRLNGRKHLIVGNHDKAYINKDGFRQQFEWIKDLYTVKVPDPEAHNGKSQRIVLCHYAMLVWDQAQRGAWHLHGHSHGSLAPDLSVRRMDVGIDATHYYPLEFAEIKTEMLSRNFWTPIDHHGTH